MFRFPLALGPFHSAPNDFCAYDNISVLNDHVAFAICARLYAHMACTVIYISEIQNCSLHVLHDSM